MRVESAPTPNRSLFIYNKLLTDTKDVLLLGTRLRVMSQGPGQHTRAPSGRCRCPKIPHGSKPENPGFSCILKGTKRGLLWGFHETGLVDGSATRFGFVLVSAQRYRNKGSCIHWKRLEMSTYLPYPDIPPQLKVPQYSQLSHHLFGLALVFDFSRPIRARPPNQP